ncbi:uncharacterized protein LOC119736656 [Patiria miniata]|uniref:Uncharacterized protein n=1 Tax=Patiria miniata TaxID=46514 RepID=A0A914ASZ4_PATMI|nr:uncharacterized protein LOC119736656 [Patiria miniata]
MESAMAFLASCVFTVLLSVSLTGGSVIPQLGDNAADIDNTGLLMRLLDAVRLPSASDNSSSDTDTVLVLDAGQGEAGQRGSRSSAPGDINLSDAPAAFALAEDLSGAQLAEILQGLLDDSTAPAGSVPVSLRCSGQPIAASTPTTHSEYTSETCHQGLIPTVNNSKVNTRGLCPWTYVEHVDIDRYPSTMLYAQCACPDCVRQSVSDDFGCHPIYNDVKVLRKHACQDGIQIYDSVYERVPVACACLRTLE